MTHSVFADDWDRQDFLLELEDAELELRPWEEQFIADNAQRHVYSEAQREVIEQLHRKFGDLVDL